MVRRPMFSSDTSGGWGLLAIVGQHAGNLVRHVADPLQIRDGLDIDGHHQPQVGWWADLGDDAGALLVDRHFHGVDLVVVNTILRAASRSWPWMAAMASVVVSPPAPIHFEVP